ncbi:MAG: tight adherence pilus pseudopilin TadF, partial [Alphaproteobacteria bacterium]
MMRNIFQYWRQSQMGAALIETALVLPVLALLALGSFELVRYILIVQKVDKAAYAIGNVVAQSIPAQTGVVDGINQVQINEIADLFNNLMRPYDDPTRQSITIRSIRKENSVFYQKWTSAGGTKTDRDKVVTFTGAVA